MLMTCCKGNRRICSFRLLQSSLVCQKFLLTTTKPKPNLMALSFYFISCCHCRFLWVWPNLLSLKVSLSWKLRRHQYPPSLPLFKLIHLSLFRFSWIASILLCWLWGAKQTLSLINYILSATENWDKCPTLDVNVQLHLIGPMSSWLHIVLINSAQ